MTIVEVATEALRTILIHLQAALLTHLRVAKDDDDMTDFRVLVDASDFGRIQSVTVLNELYMRMAQAAPLQPALPAPRRIDTLDSVRSSPLPWDDRDRGIQGTVRQPLYQTTPRPRSRQSPPKQELPPHNDDVRKSPDSRKKWGFFHSPRSRNDSATTFSQASRQDSNMEGSMPNVMITQPAPRDSPLGIQFGDREPAIWKSSSQVDLGPSRPQSYGNPTSKFASKPSPEVMIDEDNPWESEISMSASSLNDRSKTGLRELSISQPKTSLPPRQSTELLYSDEEETQTPHLKRAGKGLSPSQSLASSDPMSLVAGGPPNLESKRKQQRFSLMPRRRTTQTTLEASPPTVEVIAAPSLERSPRESLISPRPQSSPQIVGSSTIKQPYGGFCKGAYKLQVGLEKESLKLKNQSTSKTGQSFYWACASSKCAFEGPALLLGKIWKFNDRVRSSNGVQYRWKFLAKSHIALSRVRNHEYDYRCVFCDRDDALTVYRSEKVLIEHISKHRGPNAATSVTDKVCCITGRVAVEEEDFDVNLLPCDDTS